jgi:hypothetical protein
MHAIGSGDDASRYCKMRWVRLSPPFVVDKFMLFVSAWFALSFALLCMLVLAGVMHHQRRQHRGEELAVSGIHVPPNASLGAV